MRGLAESAHGLDRYGFRWVGAFRMQHRERQARVLPPVCYRAAAQHRSELLGGGWKELAVAPVQNHSVHHFFLESHEERAWASALPLFVGGHVSARLGRLSE